MPRRLEISHKYLSFPPVYGTFEFFFLSVTFFKCNIVIAALNKECFKLQFVK